LVEYVLHFDWGGSLTPIAQFRTEVKNTIIFAYVIVLYKEKYGYAVNHLLTHWANCVKTAPNGGDFHQRNRFKN